MAEPGGLRPAEAEYDELTSTGRTDIASEIEEARSHGDLKENAEYHAAKEEQGKMEGRIRQLKQLLDSAKIGTPPSGAGVLPGLIVELVIDGDDDVETYFVGSREEERDKLDVLSADSPIGTAITGAKEGETRTATLPNGKTIEIEIKAIRTP